MGSLDILLNRATTKERSMLSQYRKTVVAVIGAVVTILAIYGVNLDPELVAAVSTLATAGMVLLVRNEGAA